MSEFDKNLSAVLNTEYIPEAPKEIKPDKQEEPAGE